MATSKLDIYSAIVASYAGLMATVAIVWNVRAFYLGGPVLKVSIREKGQPTAIGTKNLSGFEVIVDNIGRTATTIRGVELNLVGDEWISIYPSSKTPLPITLASGGYADLEGLTDWGNYRGKESVPVRVIYAHNKFVGIQASVPAALSGIGQTEPSQPGK